MIDFCLDTNHTTLHNNTDLVLQQIDILFDTNPKEVLGEPDYGSDYDKFLWDMTASETTISRYIESNIRSNVDLLGHQVRVTTQLFMGTQNDIILTDIEIIAPNGDTYGKTYSIQ